MCPALSTADQFDSPGLRCCALQFKENGCENCMFFNMDKDHDRVLECTTPNFAG